MDQQTLENVRDRLDDDSFGLVRKVGLSIAAAKFLRKNPWTMIASGGTVLGLGLYFSRKDKKAKQQIEAKIQNKQSKQSKKSKKKEKAKALEP